VYSIWWFQCSEVKSKLWEVVWSLDLWTFKIPLVVQCARYLKLYADYGACVDRAIVQHDCRTNGKFSRTEWFADNEPLHHAIDGRCVDADHHRPSSPQSSSTIFSHPSLTSPWIPFSSRFWPSPPNLWCSSFRRSPTPSISPRI
jgi:hypothetical protein